MGGNGTIGGGKSADLDFTVWDNAGVEKQKWVGNDPDVISGNGSSAIRVTFHKAFVEVKPGVFERDLVNGKCVEVEWYKKLTKGKRRPRKSRKARRR